MFLNLLNIYVFKITRPVLYCCRICGIDNWGKLNRRAQIPVKQGMFMQFKTMFVTLKHHTTPLKPVITTHFNDGNLDHFCYWQNKKVVSLLVHACLRKSWIYSN